MRSRVHCLAHSQQPQITLPLNSAKHSKVSAATHLTLQNSEQVDHQIPSHKNKSRSKSQQSRQATNDNSWSQYRSHLHLTTLQGGITFQTHFYPLPPCPTKQTAQAKPQDNLEVQHGLHRTHLSSLPAQELAMTSTCCIPCQHFW